MKPVKFTVQAIVTSSDLQFDQTEVDFGYCSVYQSVRSSILLTNLSLLPQDFGFVSLPEVQYENLLRLRSNSGQSWTHQPQHQHEPKVLCLSLHATLQEGCHVVNTAMCALQVPYTDLCGCLAFINPAVLGKIINKNVEVGCYYSL